MVNVLTLKKNKILLVAAFAVILSFFFSSIVGAQTLTACPNGDDDCAEGQVCIQGKCTDPFGVDLAEEGLRGTLASDTGEVDLVGTIANVINIILSLLGILAVIIVLIGGFKWMTAGGNDEKVTEARKLLLSGVIGLAIILAAWAIARFVIDSLQGAIETTP